MNSKELFINYCKKYSKELADLQASIDKDLDFLNSDKGTLADLGLNWSIELANIGFEFGYASWLFKTKATSFSEIKADFLNTIIGNEKIEKLFNETEIAEIEKRIKSAS